MMLRGSFENVLDDHVALRPGGIDIALFDAALPKHVAVREARGDFDVVRQVLMDEWRLGRQSLVDREHGRQRLVVDLDGPCRAPGGFWIACRNGGHRLAEVNCLSPRQRHFILAESTGARRLKILTGHDGCNAWDRARGVELIAANACMRVRASQHHAVQHAGAGKVIDILRFAGHLFSCI